MGERKPSQKWQWRRPLFQVGQWVLLFAALLLAIWTVTQYREAPQLILLLLLYVITTNVSLPFSQGGVGLVPVVAVSSLLVVGWETAVLLAVAGSLLAELSYALWLPMWTNLERPSRRQRAGMALASLAALVVAGLIYRQLGGSDPFDSADPAPLASLVGLALGYGVTYFFSIVGLWLVAKRPLNAFLRHNALSVFIAGFLAQPIALLGGVTLARSGLPAFIVFCASVMAFSLAVWLSWKRQFTLQQRLAQLRSLNETGASLRETLDFSTVLVRTYRQVVALIDVDRFFIAFVDEQGQWQRPLFANDTTPDNPPPTGEAASPFEPDDFTRWVAEEGRILDLDQRNMHFAGRHRLTPPSPRPAAWLGVPLTPGERTGGVIVLQRFADGPPFSRWDREVLLAIAGQASAAIQNARLHAETVRLYNLTDKALAQRVEQLQALLNAVQEGVLMVDTHGRIVLVNPIAATLLGQPATTLQQQPLDAATAAPALGYEQQALSALLASLAAGQVPAREPTTFASHRLRKEDGRAPRIIARSEAPVLAGSGQLIGWLMLFRDVTEEREMAERRADFTRMVVHDLRNPLTTLLSTVTLMAERLPPAAKTAVGELPHAIRTGCLDMLDMVDSLMDINRMETGQFVIEAEAMRLSPLLGHVVERLRPLAMQRRIDLQVEYAPDLQPVWADAEIIRRVLVNLLDNALKFTPANGRILAQLQNEPWPTADFATGVRCTISDTGPGIPPQFQEQIFDRFMRTNRGGAQVRGTGLGLAFCKMAIEAHNGRIWAANQSQGGSRFVFTLPGIPDFDNESNTVME